MLSSVVEPSDRMELIGHRLWFCYYYLQVINTGLSTRYSVQQIYLSTVCKKKPHVQFWMSYAMFLEAAFLNELLRHIFRFKFYLVNLVRFSYICFFLSLK